MQSTSNAYSVWIIELDMYNSSSNVLPWYTEMCFKKTIKCTSASINHFSFLKYRRKNFLLVSIMQQVHWLYFQIV